MEIKIYNYNNSFNIMGIIENKSFTIDVGVNFNKAIYNSIDINKLMFIDKSNFFFYNNELSYVDNLGMININNIIINNEIYKQMRLRISKGNGSSNDIIIHNSIKEVKKINK